MITVRDNLGKQVARSREENKNCSDSKITLLCNAVTPDSVVCRSGDTLIHVQASQSAQVPIRDALATSDSTYHTNTTR